MILQNQERRCVTGSLLFVLMCSHVVILPCDVPIQRSRVKFLALVLHLLNFAVLASCSVNTDLLVFSGFVMNVLCRRICGKAWAKVQECKIFCSFVGNLFCYVISLLTVCLISISFLQGGTLPLPWSLIKMFLLWDFCHPSRTEFSFYWMNLGKVVMVEDTPGQEMTIKGRCCLVLFFSEPSHTLLFHNRDIQN